MINKFLIIIIILFLSSCKGEPDNSYLSSEKALNYFSKVEEACNRDGGKLWGVNLYGPIMFVDRNSRKITANQPDNEGLLKLRDGVYTGSYPREMLINNIAVDFGGKLFALVPLPFDEDEFRIITRSIHSLFHRFHKLNAYATSPFNTPNMDEKNARLWLKLEWNALRKAIVAEESEKEQLIRDALIFSGSKRELYPRFADDEIRFENFEGLTTFTYLLLGTSGEEEFYMRLFEQLNRTYSMSSFSRWYGNIHGALYATLLYQKGYDFRQIKSDTIDITELVKNEFNITLPELCRDVAGSIALNYDIETIQMEEQQRLETIRENIRKQTSTFIEKPVVYLELESPYFDFEPEDVHPMDTLGILYDKMRVSDNWGKLTVDKGGCLVSSNLKFLRITSKGFRQDRNRVEGEGWQILLNDQWQLVKVEDNYLIRRLFP